MSVRVKICGLSDGQGVDAAVNAGADLVGFVFFPASPRNVSPGEAAPLAAPARGRAGIVALTVDADDALLSAIASGLRPDLLQLHGRETPERVAKIRDRLKMRVMKAVGVAARQDLERARAYASAADLLLLDAKPPEGAARPGGNGAAFDWTLLDGFDPGVPWWLSGGLDAGNVAAALCAARPMGVDVSSGVERSPGVKDPALIREFVAAARDAAPARAA
jgi:phosphoribosylanthranilate isomerase